MSGTIRKVVTFGMQTKKKEERIWHALQIAEARDFVMKLPQGLDTFLGEAVALMSKVFSHTLGSEIFKARLITTENVYMLQ